MTSCINTLWSAYNQWWPSNIIQLTQICMEIHILCHAICLVKVGKNRSRSCVCIQTLLCWLHPTMIPVYKNDWNTYRNSFTVIFSFSVKFGKNGCAHMKMHAHPYKHSQNQNLERTFSYSTSLTLYQSLKRWNQFGFSWWFMESESPR